MCQTRVWKSGYIHVSLSRLGYNNSGCTIGRADPSWIISTSEFYSGTIVFSTSHVAIADTQPLHIAFNGHGLGHYDVFFFWCHPTLSNFFIHLISFLTKCTYRLKLTLRMAGYDRCGTWHLYIKSNMFGYLTLLAMHHGLPVDRHSY